MPAVDVPPHPPICSLSCLSEIVFPILLLKCHWKLNCDSPCQGRPVCLKQALVHTHSWGAKSTDLSGAVASAAAAAVTAAVAEGLGPR
eukprot:scaffold55535_cov18-Tisochrysis_lutea.AAC.1